MASSDDEKVQEAKSNILKLPCLNNEDPITMEDIQFGTEIRIIFPVVAPDGINDINNYKIPEEGHCFTTESILDRKLFTDYYNPDDEAIDPIAEDENIAEIEQKFGKQLLKYPYDRTLIINHEVLGGVYYIDKSIKLREGRWHKGLFCTDLFRIIETFNSTGILPKDNYSEFWKSVISEWNKDPENKNKGYGYKLDYAISLWDGLSDQQRALYLQKERDDKQRELEDYKDKCMLDNYIYFKIDTGIRHNGQEIHMLIHAKMFNDKFINTLGQSGCNDVKSEKDELKEREESLKRREESLEEERQALKRREESLKLKEESLEEDQETLKEDQETLKLKEQSLKEREDVVNKKEESIVVKMDEIQKIKKLLRRNEEPKGPLDAFSLFEKANKKQIKLDNPKLDDDKISKLLEKSWRDAFPATRKRYTQEAIEDRERFNYEMKNYIPSSDDDIIEKGLSSLRKREKEVKKLKSLKRILTTVKENSKMALQESIKEKDMWKKRYETVMSDHENLITHQQKIIQLLDFQLDSSIPDNEVETTDEDEKEKEEIHLPVISSEGTKRSYKDEKLHRDGDDFSVRSLIKTIEQLYKAVNLHGEGDLPAIEYSDGKKDLYQDGKLYKKELPDGTTEFYNKQGQLHRDGDKPAVENSNYKQWWKNGRLHRDNNLPAVEFSNGTKKWYKDGKLHRDDDLPAIEFTDGTKHWYKDGELVRKE